MALQTKHLTVDEWVIDPDKKQVEIYVPDQAPKTVGVNGTLDGGEVLPGFNLPVEGIFPD